MNEEVMEFAEKAKSNSTIFDSIVKADSVLNGKDYKNVCVSISGGADSDIMIDMLTKIRKDLHYVFFDTGIEYQATKKHLQYLEKKYGIEIERHNALMPVPISNKKYGQPFVSKQASLELFRLQKAGFQWEDTEDYISLIKKYCREYDHPYGEAVEIDGKWYIGCVGSILWWCNVEEETPWGREKQRTDKFMIKRNRYLKEFIVKNPPTFKISDKCCSGAKKNVSARLIKDKKYDLMIVGVRKSEGGVRQTAYKNCFSSETSKKIAQYRPLFWYKNEDRKEYEKLFDVKHSDCYEKYGLERTGCAGCPYGWNFEKELEILDQYEPKLGNAVNSIFKDSIEYSRKFAKFVEEQKKKNKKSLEKDMEQMTLDDFI